MKPHRIRMTHNLLLNYGLYRKMEIYVSSSLSPTSSRSFFEERDLGIYHVVLSPPLPSPSPPQRPHPASHEEMTRYHSDDYIRFLRTIRPDNVGEYTKLMQRCECVGVWGCESVWVVWEGWGGACGDYHVPLTVNVGEDCPVFDGLHEFCQLSAGGSIGQLSWQHNTLAYICSVVSNLKHLVSVLVCVSCCHGHMQLEPWSWTSRRRTLLSTGRADCTTPRSQRPPGSAMSMILYWPSWSCSSELPPHLPHPPTFSVTLVLMSARILETVTSTQNLVSKQLYSYQLFRKISMSCI